MCDIGLQKRDSMFYQNLVGPKAEDFPIERFKTLMDEVKWFKPYIGITTTEPLLYPHIFEAVSYAKDQGMHLNISTNGVLVDKHVDDLIKSGLHRLSVSIDGPPHIHDKMRGVPGTYNKVMAGLERLKERKKELGSKTPHLYITSFIADENYPYILEFIQNLPLEGIEKVNIKLMVFFTKDMVDQHNEKFGDKYYATCSCFPDDFSSENFKLDLLYEQTKIIKEKYADICKLHFEPDKSKFEKYFYHPNQFMDRTRCVLPWFVAQVSSQGDLLPITRCYNLSLGNIMETSFMEAWNGTEMRKFRRDLRWHGRFPACARCDGVLYR